VQKPHDARRLSKGPPRKPRNHEALGFRALVPLPAWAGFLAWITLQIVGVVMQTKGLSNTSSLAHLGGAGVGVLAWWVMRKREARSDSLYV